MKRVEDSQFNEHLTSKSGEAYEAAGQEALPPVAIAGIAVAGTLAVEGVGYGVYRFFSSKKEEEVVEEPKTKTKKRKTKKTATKKPATK